MKYVKAIPAVLLVAAPFVGLIAFALGGNYNFLLLAAAAYILIVMGILNIYAMLLTASMGVAVGLIISIFSTTPTLLLICSSLCLVNVGNSLRALGTLFKKKENDY